MLIRTAKPADAPAIAHLYYDTVHTVNARDYSPAQIEAWAPRVYGDGFWRRRFKRYRVFVAVDEDAVVGFAEFDPSGAIDCFYVHHRWQGRGVGSALMRRVVAEARRCKTRRLSADVSLTARPFFEKQGFTVVRVQKKLYRNRAFKQFVMERRL